MWKYNLADKRLKIKMRKNEPARHPADYLTEGSGKCRYIDQRQKNSSICITSPAKACREFGWRKLINRFSNTFVQFFAFLEMQPVGSVPSQMGVAKLSPLPWK
jgi:hypothetical protein